VRGGSSIGFEISASICYGGGFPVNRSVQAGALVSAVHIQRVANTTPALIVEGFEHDTVRLLEVMSAGAITVICVDFVLLFQDLLHWNEVSIRVLEHLLETVWCW
jgi:hypothetical protein